MALVSPPRSPAHVNVYNIYMAKDAEFVKGEMSEI
jgi:hypothetical protein